MAGASSSLDDSDMLEYLDTNDSESDFTLESDIDDTTEEAAPHATPPAAHTVIASEEDDMDDEGCREILSYEQPLPLPFHFQKLSQPKHMHPPDSPPIAYFHFTFTDLILTLMVTESNRYTQQVFSSKVGNAPTLVKKGITMYKMKIPGLYSKYGHHTGPLSVPKPPHCLG
jgi:hypothetical protein